VGLAIDAKGVLTGGGFLYRDPALRLDAGVMQLTLHERITLTAFGLVATTLPDGSPGYSLIVFITAEGFRPIPIGMACTLQAIGGIVAINRTFSEEAMREGLKNNTLGTLLFPRDPIRNAPEIIRNLSTTFPARSGSYLFGVLAKIGWFSPTLVLLELALIFEFGARRRLIALGRISALLPSRDNDLIRLNLDAMGVIDFDEGTAAIRGGRAGGAASRAERSRKLEHPRRHQPAAWRRTARAAAGWPARARSPGEPDGEAVSGAAQHRPRHRNLRWRAGSRHPPVHGEGSLECLPLPADPVKDQFVPAHSSR
jgi:hypothetical protein